MKLKSKKEVPYSGKVYDLSVKNKSSYNVEGIPVHNSGAGSLVCYATGITQVDPVKHGLLFERFLSKKKMCLHPDTKVSVSTNDYRKIIDLKIGDYILNGNLVPTKIIFKTIQEHENYFKIFLENEDSFICSKNHKWVIKEQNSGLEMEKETHEIKLGDALVNNFEEIKMIKFISFHQEKIKLVDIGMESNHIFWVLSSTNTYMWYKTHNSLPDIDNDCADREEAIKILTEHFGEESVLPVSNYNQLQLKSLIKDLARLYQIPFDIINPITQQIEKETLDADKQQDGFDRGVWFLSYESAEKNSPSFQALLEEYPQLESSLRILFKQIKSCFTEETLILTESGWKQFKDIFEDKDKVAYIDTTGEIKFNADFFKIENGEKELYEITFKDGKSIKLTEDHLVQTDKGWKQVKDLCEDDSLIGWI